PFPFESDEVSAGGDSSSSDAASGDKKSDKSKKDSKSEKPGSKPIDWEGIESRVCPVPVPGDEYSNLQAIDGHLIYMRSASPFYGRDAAKKPDLQIFAFKD